MESQATRQILQNIGLQGGHLDAAHDAAMRASAIGALTFKAQRGELRSDTLESEHRIHCEILTRAAPHFDANMQKRIIEEKLENIGRKIRIAKGKTQLDTREALDILQDLMMNAAMMTRPLIPREAEVKFIEGKKIAFETINEWRTGGKGRN